MVQRAGLLQTQRELALFLIVIAVLVVLSGTVVFFLESGEHDTDFVSIPSSLWWAMMTVTTIGYGDMVPQTKGGKVAVRVHYLPITYPNACLWAWRATVARNVGVRVFGSALRACTAGLRAAVETGMWTRVWPGVWTGVETGVEAGV